MNRTGKTALVFALTASLVLSSAGTADAKAKKPKLSKSKVTITVGKTKKITVKKAKPKKTKWTVNKKGKKVVKLSKKKKKSVVIKGKNKGKATVTAKITVGKKTYKKKVKVTVKKKASGGGGTTPTQKPGTGTPTPKPGTPTQNPGTPTKDPGTATDAPTDAPTDEPTNAPTDEPGATDAPKVTPEPPTKGDALEGELPLTGEEGTVRGEGAVFENDMMFLNDIMSIGLKLPFAVKNGESVNVTVRGKVGDVSFRSWLIDQAEGTLSNIETCPETGEFEWKYTLTATGDMDPSYLFFKGINWETKISNLWISQVAAVKVTGGETPTPSTGPAVTPETEEVPYTDTKKGEQDVQEYVELDAADSYVVKANGSEAEITSDVLAKVFNTDKIAELWAKDSALKYEDDIYGKTVVVSEPDVTGKRTVTVTATESGKTAVYEAVKVNEGTPEGTLEFQLTDANDVVEVITITDGNYEVKRGDVVLVSIVKDANGTYTMDIDKAWVEEVGFVLSKVKKSSGSNPPTASGPAVSGPGVEPGTPTETPDPSIIKVEISKENMAEQYGGVTGVEWDLEKGEVSYAVTSLWYGGGLKFKVNDGKGLKLNDVKTISIHASVPKAEQAEAPFVLQLDGANAVDDLKYHGNTEAEGWRADGAFVDFKYKGTNDTTFLWDIEDEYAGDANKTFTTIMLKLNKNPDESEETKPENYVRHLTIHSIEIKLKDSAVTPPAATDTPEPTEVPEEGAVDFDSAITGGQGHSVVDGVVTIVDGSIVVKLPERYEKGTKVKVHIKGTDNTSPMGWQNFSGFRMYLMGEASDKDVRSTGVGNVPQCDEFDETFVFTVGEAALTGVSKDESKPNVDYAEYIIIKGPAGGTNIEKLVITGLNITVVE